MFALRLRYGIRWKKQYPPTPYKAIALLLTMVFLVLATKEVTLAGIAKEIATAEHRALFAEKVTELYEASVRVMKQCEERNAIGYYYPDGRAYECPKPL